MPVEIKELIVRAVVRPEESADVATPSQHDSQDQDAIVEACVRQVLQILRKSKER